MSNSVPSVSERRLEDRCAPGRQDSSAAEGPFSPAGLKVRLGLKAEMLPRLPAAFCSCVAQAPVSRPRMGLLMIFIDIPMQVLVVDDDLMCLKVVSAMLKRCNYEGK